MVRRGEVLELSLGDFVTLRKAHPCGSRDWEVVRLGADIRIKCLGCGRLVLLERRQLERRVKSLRPAPPAADAGAQG